MTSDRRQFLSHCAAAGIGTGAALVTDEATNLEQPMWPSTFPALRQRVHEHPLVFLDSAATTLRPQSVIDTLVRAQDAGPHGHGGRVGAPRPAGRNAAVPHGPQHGARRRLRPGDFEHGALKFQAGTPDVAGPVGLVAAVRFFEAAGLLLRRHDDEFVQHGLVRLADIPRLRIIGPRRPDRRVPVFTFVLEGHAPTTVARALDARGIAVRAGDMAALPLLKRFGATEAVRASAHVYSTRADVDRLADALREIGK